VHVLKRVSVGGPAPIAPDDFVDEAARPEDLIHETTKLVASGLITVKKDRAPISEQLAVKEQPFVHELEILVVGPDVRVLDLLAERVSLSLDLGGALRAPE
jgi:hypothetical protein